MSKKIMLDAGHAGRYNQSPAVKAYYESEVMWKLHLLLKAALEAYGFIVGTTRPNLATDREVYDRGKAAAGYDLFVSLHSNAVGSGVNEATDYPVVIVPLNKKGDALGTQLATDIEKLMNTKQKGRIMTRAGSSGTDYYGVIRGAVAVGVVGILIEHSFHTQTAASNWLLSDTNLQRLADREAAVIASYYGVSKTTPTPSTGKTQASAFAGLSSADAAVKALETVKANALQVGLFPSVKAAQLILESGYVTSELVQAANNGFGMKKSLSGNTWPGSTWDGSSVYTKATQEQKEDGTPYTITADFRKYACLEDSIADHSAYLLGAKNGSALRYAGIAAAKDYVEQITIIKNGGYATDVSYVSKVCAVIEKHNLNRYDKTTTQTAPTTPTAPTTIKEGDIVEFMGGAVYKSSDDPIPVHSRPASRCKVTKVHNGKHPYHLISEDGKGVYGWVEAVDVITPTAATFAPYTVRVDIDDLSIRSGPGTNNARTGYTGKDTFTIVEEATGPGATKWGLLKAYQAKRNGWISLDHTKKA